MKNARTSASSTSESQTDWARVDAMRDEDINFSDIPELTAEQMARGHLEVGGKPVKRGKQRVNIYLDAWVVEMFRQKAGGRGYQTLINEALVQHLTGQEMVTLLRRVVREELQATRADH
jgi:uncharacterized protein (DUF4415 family)